MTIRKNCLTLLPAALLLAMALGSCKKFQGEVRVPAYLYLDSVAIVPQAVGAPSAEAGFYTSQVDCVELVCYFEGDTAQTNIGVFQLPFASPVPLLRHGVMKYLIVTPCVLQNGVSATRIYYPYFKPDTICSLRVSPDSVTHLGALDPATGRWTLRMHYLPKDHFDQLLTDFFEPTSFSTNFDGTVEWVKNDPAGARSGQGYGRVHIDDTTSTVSFTIPQSFAPEKTQYLYLEMDYLTDVEFRINMVGYASGTTSTLSSNGVMALYPNLQWNKIYINLGRTWSQFNYNTPIALTFDAVNSAGRGGYVRIDNVKLLAR